MSVLLGMNITGVDTTQPGPLISTWTECWSATSGMSPSFQLLICARERINCSVNSMIQRYNNCSISLGTCT